MVTALLFGAGLWLVGSGVLWIAWSVLEILRQIIFGVGPRLDDD